MLYEIHIDNDGDGQDNITYAFHFQTRLRDPNTFLYNVGPILSLDSPNWNSRQFYSVTRIEHGQSVLIGENLPCPPCNIGPLSTPHYANLANEAVHDIAGGIKVFAGQRAEGFYVDLGSIFDLANLRPFQELHAQYGMHVFSKPAAGVNATAQLNVHSIAIQVPTWELLRPGKHGASDPASVIGVWTTASRQQVTLWDDWKGENVNSGPFRQVSRLGNPLFNEVLIPLGSKDLWNSLPPTDDKRFASYVAHPELAGLLPALYPGVFPNLAKLVKAGTARADLEAILLTGIPAGIVPGFQNYTGSEQADMLRLNTAIKPSQEAERARRHRRRPGRLPQRPPGLRRRGHDRAARDRRGDLPLVDPKYKPDAAAGVVTDGLTAKSVPGGYLSTFPYLGVPHSGFSTPS